MQIDIGNHFEASEAARIRRTKRTKPNRAARNSQEYENCRHLAQRIHCEHDSYEFYHSTKQFRRLSVFYFLKFIEAFVV
jgi:hypothetical protein